MIRRPPRGAFRPKGARAGFLQHAERLASLLDGLASGVSDKPHAECDFKPLALSIKVGSPGTIAKCRGAPSAQDRWLANYRLSLRFEKRRIGKCSTPSMSSETSRAAHSCVRPAADLPW